MNELITFVWIIAGMFACLMLVAMLLMPKRVTNRFVSKTHTSADRETRHLQHRLDVLKRQYDNTVEIRDCTANLRQQNLVLARLNKLQKIVGF